jgi:glycerophosphoryl diester phosphodiesterase
LILAQAEQRRLPFVCAHGGDTSVHPANTAAAYAAALVHTDCIEIDAALTLDHQLVAMHDRDLEQLLDKPGAKVRNGPGSCTEIYNITVQESYGCSCCMCNFQTHAVQRKLLVSYYA